ncbi:hypothetical protein E3P92_01335 [Wallemia ichthyophaga]|uniref:RNA-binding S4 domain-containing protein n=2 Tax=Wallemia ichthyophaga TaxID=245174 RepID=A0A4T0IXN7_WALIC|nr:Putative 37S ribosomal protein -like protein [Wallemia ichthyophaga EXF-994]TIA74222.1 hypothetical protein E3P91_01044 [Wallemia ichthyophaga]EOQ99692.1 Putative 37S ribosomal protein -like protein [Wallemia ichthyophaga EXF-994]TIA82827.1 hypothetical protein E3P98_01205 [Wallemia ichthyophaga]TIA92631.1 hypothetical protein E3P97_01349 [Wallemia ichthyophaga]TIB04083.1 hypothetical protein E3P96_01687 [Wallemia ichthyophaga]
MSWRDSNLYNLFNLSYGFKQLDTKFNKTSATLFQQRFKAKKLVRSYHGDYLQENIFRKWFLPQQLPIITNSKSNRQGLAKWNKQPQTQSPSTPVTSLMFVELERRLDHLLFRSCMASSIYQARSIITQGHVTLNGYKHNDPNTRLDPGDLVGCNPRLVATLRSESGEKGGENEETEEIQGGELNEKSENPQQPPQSSQSPLPFHLPNYASPFLFIPPYIEPSFQTCSFIYLRHPTARPGYSEIPSPYAADGDVMKLAWEWYVGRQIRARNLGSGPWGGPRRPSGTKRGKGEERRG